MEANPIAQRSGWISTLFGATGRVVLAILGYVGGVASIAYLSFREFFLLDRQGRAETLAGVVRQMLFTGIDALPVITVMALLLGWVVIIQAGTQLPKVGAERLIGQILVVTIVRELAPLLTAFVIIGRSGSAVATELGYMRVNQELAALEVMGIPLGRFLLAPRVIGFWLATLCLTIYFAVIAILGGFALAAAMLTVPFRVFVESLQAALSLADLEMILIKCSLFGLVIAGIACLHGLRVQRSYTEIPQQTTQAIIYAVMVCFALNLVVTVLFYL